MAQQLLKVLVVDDTIVYRKVLSAIIEEIPICSLVGAASNGKLALDKIKSTEVDLILLDVEMPVMDGLETLAVLQREHPDIGVIMVSGVSESAAGITIRALERGAIDFISKPDGDDREASKAQLSAHISRLAKHFSTQRSLRSALRPAGAQTRPTPAAPVPPPPARAVSTAVAGRKTSRIDIIVIGVSTGGPNALKEVIPRLPADLGLPVLIVQHMPPMFTASLAKSLDQKSALTVSEAAEGDPVEPNTVLIAPGGKHMVLRAAEGGKHIIALNENPPEHNCRPSVNVLFRSVATYCGGRVLSVIMTGMGEDGCEGVRALKRQGGLVLTQAASTCVVYGMPRAVDEAGLSDAQVPLEQLAERIARVSRHPATAI